MANKHRGEVPFEVDGVSYTLRLSSNALCELESVLGVEAATDAFAEVTKMASEGRIKCIPIRAIFWAALSETAQGIDLRKAGEIITTLGDIEAIKLIVKLITATWPQSEAKGEGTQNPK